MSKKYKILNDPDQHSLNNSDGDYFRRHDLIAQTPDGLIRVRGVNPIDNPRKIKGKWSLQYNDMIKRTDYDIVNGASIPWFAQWLISKSGKWNRSSDFHDVGYARGGIEFFINGRWIFQKKSRTWFDNLYLELMASRNVARWNRKTQYEILKTCGWYRWNQCRKLNP